MEPGSTGIWGGSSSRPSSRPNCRVLHVALIKKGVVSEYESQTSVRTTHGCTNYALLLKKNPTPIYNPKKNHSPTSQLKLIRRTYIQRVLIKLLALFDSRMYFTPCYSLLFDNKQGLMLTLSHEEWTEINETAVSYKGNVPGGKDVVKIRVSSFA